MYPAILRPMLLGAACAFAPVAFAQTTETVTPRTTILDEDQFGLLEVDGQLLGPAIERIAERPPARFSPLIRLRMDFNDEMVDSVSQVR